jgi:hypothetical protein
MILGDIREVVNEAPAPNTKCERGKDEDHSRIYLVTFPSPDPTPSKIMTFCHSLIYSDLNKTLEEIMKAEICLNLLLRIPENKKQRQEGFKVDQI